MDFKDKIDSLFGDLVRQTLEERKITAEDASNNKSDDGEGLDKADPKAAKKKFKDRKDKDIDNDGDTDSSDEYLHKRRKAIGKALAKENSAKKLEAVAVTEKKDKFDRDMTAAEKKKFDKLYKKAIGSPEEKRFKLDFKGSQVAADDAFHGMIRRKAMGESVSLEEGMDNAARDMESYARKSGGIDKKDFNKAAAMMRKGDEKKLVKFTNDQDTEVRDKIIDIVAKQVGVPKASKMFNVSMREETTISEADIDAVMEWIGDTDIDNLTEEQLDELIGRAVRGIAKGVGAVARGAGKGAVGAVRGGIKVKKRLSTAGRADAADQRARKAEKKAADRERMNIARKREQEAKKRLRTAKRNKNNTATATANEAEVEEGKRGFILAAKQAKERGEKSFMFAGTEYQCESYRLDEASKTIDAMMQIVDRKQAMKVDGVLVDMFTASAIKQIYTKVNDANKAKMDKMKATQLANVAMKLLKKEELEEASKICESCGKVHEGSCMEEKTECPQCDGEGCDHCDGKGYHDSGIEEKKNYEYKNGKVHISKKDFRKVHKDYKNSTKGKERMMVLDPKTQATVSALVQFTESSFKMKFKRSLSKRLGESSKNEEKSDEVANRYNELKTLAPVELMKLYQKHYGDDDIDKAKNMDKSQLISKIVDKEFESTGEE